MNVSDLLKCQILKNQINSLMAVNDEISKQFELSRERLYEVKDIQMAVNEQLDKYKLELDAFNELVLPNDECIRVLGLLQ